jgi:hypothetical protein
MTIAINGFGGLLGRHCRHCAIPDPPEPPKQLRVEERERRIYWNQLRRRLEPNGVLVVRFRFFRSRGAWQLYWMHRDLKWHRYDPACARGYSDAAGSLRARPPRKNLC